MGLRSKCWTVNHAHEGTDSFGQLARTQWPKFTELLRHGQKRSEYGSCLYRGTRDDLRDVPLAT